MKKISRKKSLDTNLAKIKNSLKSEFEQVFLWLGKSEGQLLSNSLMTLSALLPQPFGIVFPMVMQCSDYLIRERFLKHFPDLVTKLAAEKSRINEEFLKSPEARELLRDVLGEIIKQTDEEKIEYLKKFLLNSYAMVDMNYQEINEFLEILKSFQPTQLQILNILVNPQVTVEKIIEKWRLQRHQTWALRDDLMDILQLDKEFFNRSISKLESFGLISPASGSMLIQWDTGKYVEESLDSTRTQMITKYQKLVTDFGLKFVKFFSY